MNKKTRNPYACIYARLGGRVVCVYLSNTTITTVYKFYVYFVYILYNFYVNQYFAMCFHVIFSMFILFIMFIENTL